jgi:hypothetical protein
MADEGALGIDRRGDGVSRASEGHQEGIPLRVHFVAMPALEAGTQQVPAL